MANRCVQSKVMCPLCFPRESVHNGSNVVATCCVFSLQHPNCLISPLLVGQDQFRIILNKRFLAKRGMSQKTHHSVWNMSDLDNQTGQDLVSLRIGDLLGLLVLGCLPFLISSWQSFVSALQMCSLLFPQPLVLFIIQNQELYCSCQIYRYKSAKDGFLIFNIPEARLKGNNYNFGKEFSRKNI